MAKGPDQLGQLLVRQGTLDAEALSDVLRQQQRTLPLASMAYVLGHADEKSLVMGLSRQVGLPGVAFDGAKIDLSLMEGFEPSWLIHHMIMPVHKQDRRLFLAVSDPKSISKLFRQIEFDHDVTLVVHVSLHVTLARTIRDAVRAREKGQLVLSGALAKPDHSGPVFVQASSLPEEDVERVAGPSSRRHETHTGELDELMSMSTGTTDPLGDVSEGTTHPRGNKAIRYDRAETQLDLDASRSPAVREESAKRILIVDEDPGSRGQLARALHQDGYLVVEADGGDGTLDILRETILSAVILDAMLTDFDSLQVCRAIKRSRRYRHLPVILMSAFPDTDLAKHRALQQYNADAYFKKPADLDLLLDRLRELLAGSQDQSDALSIVDDTFDGAMDFFRQGKLDAAMEQLRLGIEDDPLSARHHFLLANLLHTRGDVYEAIGAYETVVNLCPRYFPALTRLAYLYYEKGYSAKAVDTWRRSLPCCKDLVMRASIEDFMQKLITQMRTQA